MQWSLKSLLIAVAVLPIAAYALYKSTPIFVSVVVTIAGAMWIATAIMAWCAEERRRTWARGALIAATAYSLFVFYLDEASLMGSRLATSQLLGYAYTLVPQESPTPQPVVFTNPNPSGAPMYAEQPVYVQPSPVTNPPGIAPVALPSAWVTYQLVSPQPQDFGVVGHSYWAILIGLLGGWFALFIDRQRPREEPANVTQTQNP